jgi:hypothetical protein
MASTPCSIDVWHPSRTRWTDSRPRPRGRLRARPLARSSAVPPGVPPSWSASGELDLAAPHPGHGSGPGRAERAPPIVVGGDWRRRRALVRGERDSTTEWGGDGNGKAEDALGTCGKRERERNIHGRSNTTGLKSGPRYTSSMQHQPRPERHPPVRVDPCSTGKALRSQRLRQRLPVYLILRLNLLVFLYL